MYLRMRAALRIIISHICLWLPSIAGIVMVWVTGVGSHLCSSTSLTKPIKPKTLRIRADRRIVRQLITHGKECFIKTYRSGVPHPPIGRPVPASLSVFRAPRYVGTTWGRYQVLRTMSEEAISRLLTLPYGSVKLSWYTTKDNWTAVSVGFSRARVNRLLRSTALLRDASSDWKDRAPISAINRERSRLNAISERGNAWTVDRILNVRKHSSITERY